MVSYASRVVVPGTIPGFLVMMSSPVYQITAS